MEKQFPVVIRIRTVSGNIELLRKGFDLGRPIDGNEGSQIVGLMEEKCFLFFLPPGVQHTCQRVFIELKDKLADKRVEEVLECVGCLCELAWRGAGDDTNVHAVMIFGDHRFSSSEEGRANWQFALFS